MTVIPPIEDKPTRFGSPSKVLEATAWEPFGENVFVCRVLLCPEPEGGYSAHALRLPGVASQGESIAEALQNIKEAFRAAISVYRENNEKIPWERITIDRPAGSLERWMLVDV
jgi:predicted RNase H-like HicB family nuclease